LLGSERVEMTTESESTESESTESKPKQESEQESESTTESTASTRPFDERSVQTKGEEKEDPYKILIGVTSETTERLGPEIIEDERRAREVTMQRVEVKNTIQEIQTVTVTAVMDLVKRRKKKMKIPL
jgi:hypothetical protein